MGIGSLRTWMGAGQETSPIKLIGGIWAGGDQGFRR